MMLYQVSVFLNGTYNFFEAREEVEDTKLCGPTMTAKAERKVDEAH